MRTSGEEKVDAKWGEDDEPDALDARSAAAWGWRRRPSSDAYLPFLHCRLHCWAATATGGGMVKVKGNEAAVHHQSIKPSGGSG